jgi:flagellar basal body rod protein FlgG
MSFSTETVAGAMQAYVTGQEICSRNLANVNTPGFKRNIAMVEAAESDGGGTPSVTSSGIDLSEGADQATSGELDFAIHGEGFFTLSGEDGLRFTRNGSFRLNENRILVTQQGKPVLGEGGEIQIPVDSGPVVVGRSGDIRAGDQVIGRLRITAFDQPQMLRQAGSSEFKDEGGAPREARTFAVHQGFIESSNVNPIGELVRMMTAYRNYESCSRSLRALEDAAARLYSWARS